MCRSGVGVGVGVGHDKRFEGLNLVYRNLITRMACKRLNTRIYVYIYIYIKPNIYSVYMYMFMFDIKIRITRSLSVAARNPCAWSERFLVKARITVIFGRA